jgi:lipopolysaccharide/colanic/teichoic acid biosynthesis glycosyltransferase
MLGKRVFDFAVAALGLALLAVPLLLIAAWVRLDSAGPALYRQERVGREGRRFRLIKFRSMVTGADRLGTLTMGEDHRVTRAGRILRDTKLDELPQLINVLRGEMSLVGPRPEVTEYVALYTDEERAEVLSVRPGLTDEASIAFRDEERLLGGQPDARKYYVETLMPAKIRLYRKYVRERSFAGDLRLIWRTVVAVLSRGTRYGPGSRDRGA